MPKMGLQRRGTLRFNEDEKTTRENKALNKELSKMREEIEKVKEDAKKERTKLDHRIEDLELVAPVNDATWVQEKSILKYPKSKQEKH